jgi:hypothetical protein
MQGFLCFNGFAEALLTALITADRLSSAQVCESNLILVCEFPRFVIEGPLVQGDDIASEKYNLTTPVITKGYENNPDIFTQRRNSYSERRIMVFCRQIVDKEK